MFNSPLNPKLYLLSLVGKTVVVKLKLGLEYKGFLVSADEYMNLLLANTEEYIDGENRRNLGEVWVSCDNVVYVRDVEE